MYNINYLQIQGKQLLGKILGLSKNNERGTVLGEDENRYTFTIDDITNNAIPEKNMCIKFVPNNSKATLISTCEACFKEKSNLLFGITTIFLTLIFGCIGTFVSRYLFAKLPLKKVLLPTILHFLISSVIFIPFLGFIFYILILLFFTVKNYKIIMSQ